jgi:hypothetical protein
MKEKLYVLTCMPDMAVVEELITFPPAPYSNQIGQRVSCRRRRRRRRRRLVFVDGGGGAKG